MKAQAYVLAAGGFVAVMIGFYVWLNQQYKKLRDDEALRQANGRNDRADRTEQMWFRRPRWRRRPDSETCPWK